MKIETVQDVIKYLEKDIEITSKLKVGDKFENILSDKESTIEESDKMLRSIVTNYLTRILIPVLKGELDNKHTL